MKKFKAVIVALCFAVVGIMAAACGETMTLTLATEDGSLSVKPGASVQLVTTPSGNEDLTGLTYNITSGAEDATVSNSGLLEVKTTATVGNTIKVVSKLSGTTSNELTITVDRIAITSIQLSADRTTIQAGGFATITTTKNPTDTTDIVQYQITEGSEIAEFIGNKLIINDTATSGTIIKLKAVCGTVISNELTFTVGLSSEEVLYVSMDSNMTVDSKDSQTSNVLIATVKNANFNDVTGKVVDFQIVEGEEFITISSSGYNCSINVIGHGTAKIRATLENGQKTETTIKAIKSPDALEVHEVFFQDNRRNINYTVGNTVALPFAVEIRGNKVAQEVAYTFEKKVGGTFESGNFATYANGEITWNTTGEIRVTATSVSGSIQEARVSQTFVVNEGINVATFEELKTELEKTTERRIINIVTFAKPSSNYRYELVPEYALDKLAGKWYNSGVIDSEAVLQSLRISTQGDVTLNANNHRINLTEVGRDARINLGNSAMFAITPVGAGTNYTVNINDLIIIGDVVSPMDSNTDNTYYRALRIGSRNDDLYGSLFLTMNNVNISGFRTGLRVEYAVNSRISNTRVANCWGNGMETINCIITLENMTYGFCGSTSLEVTPDGTERPGGEAGLNFNEPQKITFAGYMISEDGNENNGRTPTLNKSFLENGMDIVTLMGASLQAAGLSLEDAATLSNIIKFKDGNVTEFWFQFVALVFNDLESLQVGIIKPNQSVIDYSNADANGIIEAGSLNGINTTHQYIMLTINVPGFPAAVGRVILKNWNYAA